MVALQNVQHILVRASDKAEFTRTACVTKTMHHRGHKMNFLHIYFSMFLSMFHFRQANLGTEIILSVSAIISKIEIKKNI